MVTQQNLEAIGDTTWFITRLPATYKEHDRVVHAAVVAGSWVDYGVLAKTPATAKRPAARYRGQETTVTLYGKTYWAIVVHSNAHDQRRQKRLKRRLAKERTACQKELRNAAKTLLLPRRRGCRRQGSATSAPLLPRPGPRRGTTSALCPRPTQSRWFSHGSPDALWHHRHRAPTAPRRGYGPRRNRLLGAADQRSPRGAAGCFYPL